MLRAPFPYFGGKATVAAEIWDRFGDVPNFVDPFAGSLAVLLCRPHEPKIETVNDLDAFLANFWRALQHDPEAVTYYADWPVNETDLEARHWWLITTGKERLEQLRWNPDYYDAQAAGWWVWGLCCWIGAGWCFGVGPHHPDGDATAGLYRQRPHLGSAGQGIHRKLPHLGDAGQGIHRKRPHLGSAGQGIHRQLPHLGSAGQGIHRKLPHLGDAGQGIQDYFVVLAERLRRVRVCCGDWTRVLGPTPTTKQGLTAVLLDPPYAQDERESELYRLESKVSDDVRAWAIEHGSDPQLRIALCGYEGEHTMPDDWEELAWKANGGYGSQSTRHDNPNARRERIWFSPHCLKTDRARALSLWDDMSATTSADGRG